MIPKRQFGEFPSPKTPRQEFSVPKKAVEEIKKEELVFWLGKWQGTAKGDYYIRNDLFKFFQKLKEQGKKPVGIKVDDSWNMEIIVAIKE